MTQLQLKLHQPWAQGYLETGAVASVRLLTDASGKVAKEWWSRERTIAVAGGDGQTGEHTVFDLPSGGYYGVNIIFPRGPDISVEFLVEEGEVRTETVAMAVSPHEYLGWQQFARIVRADPYKPEAARGAKAPRSTDSRRDVLMMKGQSRIDALYGKTRGAPQVFEAELPAKREAWELVPRATRGGDRGWARGRGPLDWPTQEDPEFVTWFREMPTGEEGVELVRRLREQSPPTDGLDRKFPRWVSFETDGQIDLASVPWAWWGAQRNDDEEIRFLYDLIRPSAVDREAPGHLTVSVHDRRWFGLLEFLASGRLTRTGDMFDAVLEHERPEDLYDPEVALHGKVKGPLVAVAGGILLIARAQSTERQKWDEWLENLSQWFPGIPDGATLLGCRRVEQARDLGELEEAYFHLREGVARGIPFFSPTIQMLAVALAQIGDDIPEADDLRRYIAPVASRVAPDQPFTVIRL